MALFAFAAAGVVTILAVGLIVLALVVYLVSIILHLRKITAGLAEVMGGVSEIVDKSAPVNGVVKTINEQLDTGVDLLEGLLVKKAGMDDALGLVDGLYPGSASGGFRKFPGSGTNKVPRIAEVYTRGTLTLARLGREAPIAAASPAGPALRDAGYGSAAAMKLYPDPRGEGNRPRSPVVGTGAPIQYGPSPPDTISWGRSTPEPPPGAPEPPPAAPEPQAAAPEPPPAAPEPPPAAPEPPPAAPEPPPAASPDAPQTISWKRS
jgi:hypothetical protein